MGDFVTGEGGGGVGRSELGAEVRAPGGVRDWPEGERSGAQRSSGRLERA